MPSEKEWQILIDFAGGKENSKKLNSQCGWKKCGPTKIDERGRTIEGYCTNELGFSAKPDGDVGDPSWWTSDIFSGYEGEKQTTASMFCSPICKISFRERFRYKTSNYMYNIRCIKD
ncbi:MAG: hypothetical protein FWC26_03460 [Fibromonadales bacterium]|nr:hypothetical protein [Fibromonadales bacterium]